MYLDPSKILMVSKAGSMKYSSDPKLHAISDELYEEDNWKLTLLDADKSVKDATLTCAETKAGTGLGQYQISCTYKGKAEDKLSIMVTDKAYNAEGAQILCYGYVNPKNNNNMYEVIPATGQSPDEDGTGQGDLRVDLEITQDAPIASGGIYNTKKELLDAPGIFSEAEKAAIAEGKEAKVWVEITKTDLAEEEKAAFEQEAKKTAGENARLVYFSAELFRQIGESVERISEPGAKIRLIIRIPDELVNTDSTISREYFILRMHDGELTVLNGSFDKDTREYTFETDKFSDYAIVCKDTRIETKLDDRKNDSKGSSGGSSKAPVTSANTGDRNQPLAWMILAVAATGIIAAAIRRKKRQ